ncbi:hypothetical protein FHS20_003125 [Phyllobacterium endophyticum]|nr:hypothetical protein [Phyllobacterium endophyticum]
MNRTHAPNWVLRQEWKSEIINHPRSPNKKTGGTGGNIVRNSLYGVQL